jgi:4-aminobutyrate aminotransferase
VSTPIARPLARARAVLDRDRLAVADCMKIRFCGAELVTDRATREPAAIDAARLVYRCFELGLLVIYTGLTSNVIELTPPLTITTTDVEEMLATFDHALSDVEAGRFDDGKLSGYAGW